MTTKDAAPAGSDENDASASAADENTTASSAAASKSLTLRERARAAGGWYAWINATLIRAAGPAAVGPYESTPPPSVAERAERACPLCGAPMSAHEFDRSGPKPLMHCP